MASAFNREQQNDDIRAKIIVAAERLSTAFRAGLWEEAKLHNLSPLQVQILLFVAFHGCNECSVSRIAKEFAVTKATVSDAVKTLLVKNLLQKNTTEDARGFLLSLTDYGKNCVDKLSGTGNFLRSSLEHVEDTEINKIWEGMFLLIKNLQGTRIIPVRMCFSCKHFGKEHAQGTPHFCNLMQKPLAINDLRIDCPEHLC